MIKLFSEKKRWGIIKPNTGSTSFDIGIHRSRADGSTIGLSVPGFPRRKYVTLQTEELVTLLLHVTHTETQLQEIRDGKER